MNSLPFDPSESLAVARLVYVLITSDECVNRQESDFFEQLLRKLNVETTDLTDSLAEPIDQTYEVIRRMPFAKRGECGRLLRMAVNADNAVELSELTSLNEILEKASIFKPDMKSRKKLEGDFL